MSSINDRPMISLTLRDQLVIAMASSRVHHRLYDPENVIAKAAVDDLIESLAASGFIVTRSAIMLANSSDGAECSDRLQS